MRNETETKHSETKQNLYTEKRKRYRAVFIFIWECTRLLPNEIYSVSVKYIFDYKVKFLRYIRTYSLNGCGCRGMIFFLEFIEWSRFVSFLSLHILFRFVSQFTDFVSFRRNSFRFVSLFFVSVSFLTLRGWDLQDEKSRKKSLRISM